jgi:hypothetical protein
MIYRFQTLFQSQVASLLLGKLAKLHRDSGNHKAAAHYYRLNLVGADTLTCSRIT